MILLHTTIYKPYSGILRRAWASPAGSASRSKFGPVRAVEAFSRAVALPPGLARFRASWALLCGLAVVRLGLPRWK